ncbi:hypothetical protein [Pseudomonas mandelii]|uniref:hypothetical protein n=1 Tax=Pseudomonas mandelii TaxID=75612 RepID=UPI00224A8DB4|nr:hypothetical protein [Pseudomonas mandelii]MCX2900241.1 hypothetical protein [Pseudomonas mandelii]
MRIDPKAWAQRFTDFQVEAELLLAKTEECLTHLQLISNDKDAIDCILSTLLKLASKADALALVAVSSFALQVHSVLNHAHHHMPLHDEALAALKDCLTLIAWQLELIDRSTGQLFLDDSEQTELIEAFAFQVGHHPFQPPMSAKPFTLVGFPTVHA